MIRLVLCRHGQSEADLEPRRIEGNADFPLTPLGHRQGDLLARAIAARYQVDRVITSPLVRARETAEKIAAVTGLPLTVEPRLAERSNGLLAGLTSDEADRRFPVRHPVPIHHRPPEGESYLDHFRRVADWYFATYYTEALDKKTVVVVSHGGTINCLLDAALGLPPLAQVDFLCADTCIHELHLQPGGRVRVVHLNDTSHLEGLT
ncbi:MAG TPA: histidine phosphatase family protein [Symbiobacteriaceae bacterium]